MKKQEIIQKIKDREVAIFNDDKDSLIKCLKIVFPKDTLKEQGEGLYYYAMTDTVFWNSYEYRPQYFNSEIKATELLKILESDNINTNNLPLLTETQQFKAIGRLAGRYLNKPLKQLNDYTEVQFLQRSGDYYHFLCDKKYVVVCVIVSEN